MLVQRAVFWVVHINLHNSSLGLRRAQRSVRILYVYASVRLEMAAILLSSSVSVPVLLSFIAWNCCSWYKIYLSLSGLNVSMHPIKAIFYCVQSSFILVAKYKFLVIVITSSIYSFFKSRSLLYQMSVSSSWSLLKTNHTFVLLIDPGSLYYRMYLIHWWWQLYNNCIKYDVIKQVSIIIPR